MLATSPHAMPYPGSPTIAPDTQKRILGMFQQSLELAAHGRGQEARLGCDFILRMDGAFEPARVLRARIDSAGGGAADVADLVAFASAPADPVPAATVQMKIPAPAPAPASGPPPGVSALAAGLESLLARRELKRLVQVAEENRQEVATDPRLRKTVEAAYSLMEAEPYVRSFLDGARAAFQRGDVAEAGRNLAKARSLDPGHPELQELERAPIPSPRPQAVAPVEQAPWDAPLGELPGLGSGLPALPGLDDFDSGGLASSSSEAVFGSTDPRIQQLLDEGQAHLDRGDVQAAIDAWSRIFLIDIDHQQAALRIEQARRLKAEGDRRVEEILHDGVVAMESGDGVRARALFEQVLSLQPSHLGAREYLESLDASAAPGGEAAGPATFYEDESPLLPGSTAPGGGPSLREAILVPPAPSSQRGSAGTAARSSAKGKGRRPAPARRTDSRQRFVIIAAAVVAVLGLVGGLMWLNRGSLFPNSGNRPSAAGQRDVLAEARSLHDKGKTALAVRLLKSVKAADPRHAEAQELLASLEAPAPKAPAAASEPGAPPPSTLPAGEAQALQSEDLTRAQRAYDQSEFLLADNWLKRAASHGVTLPESANLLLKRTQGQLEPLQRQILLFRQSEWERALPELWVLYQAQPGNRDLRRLMVDCYYNLSVRDLQRGNPAAALEKLREAAALRPDLKAVTRLKSFAETYSSRQPDLLYRIFTNQLEFRQ